MINIINIIGVFGLFIFGTLLLMYFNGELSEFLVNMLYLGETLQ